MAVTVIVFCNWGLLRENMALYKGILGDVTAETCNG